MKNENKEQDAVVVKKKKNVNNTNWIKQSKLMWFVSFLLLVGFISYVLN